MFSPFSKNALANTTKVFKAVGLSVTYVGIHLHSLVVSHSQNLLTRVMIQGRSDRDTASRQRLASLRLGSLNDEMLFISTCTLLTLPC